MRQRGEKGRLTPFLASLPRPSSSFYPSARVASSKGVVGGRGWLSSQGYKKLERWVPEVKAMPGTLSVKWLLRLGFYVFPQPNTFPHNLYADMVFRGRLLAD